MEGGGDKVASRSSSLLNVRTVNAVCRMGIMRETCHARLAGTGRKRKSISETEWRSYNRGPCDLRRYRTRCDTACSRGKESKSRA